MQRYFGRLFFFGIVTSIVVLLIGCTSVRLNSVKDNARVKKINHLFVVVRQGEVGKTTLSDQFIRHFRAQLTNSEVKVEFSIMTPLELDEKSHLDRAKAFEAEAILLVR